MPSNHASQKKALKHKKKREVAAKKARESTRLATHPSAGELLRAAAGRPLGPAFVSADWDVDDGMPRLVSVVVSRKVSGQLLLGALVLLDRTCLGVKNAMLFPPQSELELEQRVAKMGYQIGELRRVDPLLAQSAVYNAIDYARALGFEPHRDFPEAVFGPRPSVLIETPLARRAKPLYIQGPDDNVALIVAKLGKAVGPGGFDLTAGIPPGFDFDEDDYDDEGDEPLLST
ncbi:MAG: hypothetical protein ABJE95_39725 [Byssovorax sp.]